MKKISLILGLVILFYIVTGCGVSSDVCYEERVKLTPEEWQEESEAQEYCRALDYFDAVDSVRECVVGELSWGLSERYEKFIYQLEECPKILAEERRQKNIKPSEVDNKIADMERKSQKGIEIKLEAYWTLDRLKEFKPQLNTNLEIPTYKIATIESKEDDIRFFYLIWKKEDILNNQEEIKADFLSSLKNAVQEIKDTGEFELIFVYVVEEDMEDLSDLQTKSVGDLDINIFRVNENTDYSQIVTSGYGIFNR